MRHICKMEKLEIRAVIKYFCKKGMPPKEIHEDFMELHVLLNYLLCTCFSYENTFYGGGQVLIRLKSRDES